VVSPVKVAVVTILQGETAQTNDYHVHSTKAFVEERSGGRFSIDILKVVMSDEPAILASRIISGGYRVVLFQILYWNVSYFRRVVALLEKSDCLIGVWGHDSFAYPESYLKGPVRFIVPDEPELPLYEITALLEEGGDIGCAADIIFRDDAAKTYRYGTHRVIEPLDLIPSPYRTGLIKVNEQTSVFWEVSRGCLFRCDFCVDFSHLSPVRHHSFNYLKDELALFRQQGVRHLIIGAPIFNLNRQYFMKVLDLIEEYLPGALIEMQVRPDLLAREEIRRLAEMNVLLHIGIPSFNPKVLEQLTTSLNREKLIQNIRYLNSYPSLPFTIDIIGGLPRVTYDQTIRDIEQSLLLWPVRLNLYRLSLYPGTKIYNRIREYGLKVEHAYPWRIIESPTFSRRELLKIDEIAEGIETLYNQGRLVSIFSMLANALALSPVEIVERWNRYRTKEGLPLEAHEKFELLYKHIHTFFKQTFEKLQKKKLWPLAEDLLEQNRMYTQSLLTPEEDRITLPYHIETMNDKTVVGINRSALLHRFSYNIEDVVDAGYIDLRRYVSEEEKESLYGIVYRLEGGVFTRTISEEEGMIFSFLITHGETPLGKLSRRFPSVNVPSIVATWCDAGVLYLTD